MIKTDKYALYFPSSFAFGIKGIPSYFKNYSFCYLTFERKLK